MTHEGDYAIDPEGFGEHPAIDVANAIRELGVDLPMPTAEEALSSTVAHIAALHQEITAIRAQARTMAAEVKRVHEEFHPTPIPICVACRYLYREVEPWPCARYNAAQAVLDGG